jgi:RNA polymerase sigma factor (sigma-70 family)
MNPGDDSSGLVEALRAGDADAWNEFRTIVRDVVLPRLPLSDGLDREEILTDVNTSLWLSLDSLRNSSKLLAFTTTIARRIVGRKLRSRRQFVPLESEPTAPVQDSPSRHLENRELLDMMVGSLEDADRALFRLLYLTSSSSEEAQRTLSVSPGVFRQRKLRLRRRLQQAADRA